MEELRLNILAPTEVFAGHFEVLFAQFEESVVHTKKPDQVVGVVFRIVELLFQSAEYPSLPTLNVSHLEQIVLRPW